MMTSNLLHPRKRIAWGATFAVVLLFVGASILGERLYRIWRSNEALQLKIASLQKRVRDKPVQGLSKTQLEDQKLWAALAIEFQYPWSTIFSSIEQAATPEIELLEFQPTKSNRSILLGGEAKTQKSLENFLHRLEENDRLIAVHLTHQEIVIRDKLQTVSFEIKASLK